MKTITELLGKHVSTATCSFFGLSMLAVVPPASAQTIEGSSLTQRNYRDSSPGQVYIYAGGTFAADVQVNTFSWHNGNALGYSVPGDLTPILFEETSPGTFVIRGVGTDVFPIVSGAPQSAPFGLKYGTDTTTDGNFTFGFINANVNGSGVQTSISLGTTDWNDPNDGGNGVAGAGSNNRWAFTPSSFSQGDNLTLGESFTLGGGGANGLAGYRTYSAELSSSPVRAPDASGTALLLLFSSGFMGVLRQRLA